MKAAVVEDAGRPPVYADFADPKPGDGEALIRVTAAAVSRVVKGRASGAHYSASKQFPFIVGLDGVGRLDDGARVYFVLARPPYGSMAEWTVVPRGQWLGLPDNLDDVAAAAIAIPGMSSWAAYTDRAGLKAGETVLVNGAAGTSGRLAVQIARHLGAKKVIATGRDAVTLKSIAALGADVVIPLAEDEAALEKQFAEQFAKGVDVVVDYLWGRSAELLLVAAAKAADARPLRFVQIGSMSGETIALPSAMLRAAPIALLGSGFGSVAPAGLIAAFDGVLKAAVAAGLSVAATPVPLADFERAWREDDSRRRTVFTMGRG